MVRGKIEEAFSIGDQLMLVFVEKKRDMGKKKNNRCT
jgi:hypothetical protein